MSRLNSSKSYNKTTSMVNGNEEDSSSSSSSSSSYPEHDQCRPTDMASIMRKQKQCIEILKRFRHYYITTKKPDIIVNSNESMEYMHEIFMNIKYLIQESKEQINFLEILSESELVRIFVNLFEYCLIGLSVSPIGLKGSILKDILRLHHYLNSLAQLVWCLTNFSAKFRTSFHTQNGTRALLDFIRDQTVVDNYILYKRNDLIELDKKFSLMKALVGSLHNLSKTVSFEGMILGFNIRK